MKYFTKEWYNKMQCTGMHVLLRKDERCKYYSEELYNELYNIEKRQYMKIMSFCEDFDEFCKLMKNMDKDFASLEENEKQQRFHEFRDDELNGMSLGENFDRKIEFAIKGLKEKLSDNILSIIPDIRVLALGYASEEVYKTLEEVSILNDKFVNGKIKEYAAYLKDNADEGIQLLDENLHDAFVSKAEIVDNDLHLSVENIDLENKKIIFKDCEIVLDEGINDSYWLYNEVYNIDGWLEIHILASRGNLKELIIKCSEVLVK